MGESPPYPPAQDLVDGSTFLQRALGHHLGPHLLHVQHEGIERLLDVGFLLLLLLYCHGGFPARKVGLGVRTPRMSPCPHSWPGPHSRAASRAGAGLGGLLLDDGRDDGGVWDA